MSAVPMLPLRGVLGTVAEPASSSSRLARRHRDKLLASHTGGDPSGLMFASTPMLPLGLATADSMTSIASLGTPAGRTPAKVTLPLLLDSRPADRDSAADNSGSVVPTPSEEIDLEVKGMASALVLRSAASMLRGARWRAAQQRRLAAAAPEGSESARRAHFADGGGQKLAGGVLEAFPAGSGVRALGAVTGPDLAAAQMLSQPGACCGRRAAALVATLLAACDARRVSAAALPRAADAAAALAVRLLCTAQEAAREGPQATAVMRRVLFKSLTLLCQPHMQTPPSAPPPAGLSRAERRRSLPPAGAPACERWALATRPPEAARPLHHLPHAIARRLAVLTAAESSHGARAETASLLQLAAQLVAVSAPLAVQEAAFAALLGPLEGVAQYVAAAGDVAQWHPSLVHLVDCLLLALTGTPRDLCMVPLTCARKRSGQIWGRAAQGSCATCCCRAPRASASSRSSRSAPPSSTRCSTTRAHSSSRRARPPARRTPPAPPAPPPARAPSPSSPPTPPSCTASPRATRRRSTARCSRGALSTGRAP